MKRLGYATVPALFLAACASTPSPVALREASYAPQRTGGDEAYHAEGLYVGLAQTTAQYLADDLESGGVVVGENDFVTVPSFDGETGIGILPTVGYRWHRRALEVGIAYSEWDPDFGSTVDTELLGLQINWKEFYNVDGNLQPFLFLGIEMLEMRLDDAAFTTDLSVVKDAELDGIGVNVGGGLSFFVTPRLALNGQVHYSFAEFTEADAISSPPQIDGSIEADGWTVGLGASYTF
ncbi:MAG: hypothetical protein AAF682_16265 [Planctomycetota bacterium]